MAQITGLISFNKNKQAGYVWLLLLSAMSMVVASWLRSSFAHTVMVDEHEIGGAPALLVYTLFCAGLTGYSVTCFRIWKDELLSINQTRVLAYVTAFLFSFMIPFLSNDIFSLLTYGDLANKGVDVFSQPHLPHVSPFLSYCNVTRGDGPCVYGPVSLAISQLAVLVSHGNVFVALIAYKLISFFWVIVFIEFAFRIAKSVSLSQGAFLFVVLNPVLMLQGVGQLHCDMIAAAITLGTVYAVVKNRPGLAFLFAAFAIAVKMNYVLVLPFIAIMMFLNKESWREFAIKLSAGVGVIALALVVMYWPYFTSADTLFLPFREVYHQVPSKSIPEVLGGGIFYAQQYLQGSLNISSAVTADAAAADQKLMIWNYLVYICRSIAIGTSILLIINFFRTGRDERNWMKLYPKLLLLFLLFYSHVIYPWYLVMFLPFMWYENDRSFMTWLWVLCGFSSAQTIMSAIDRGSWVYFLVVPLIAVNAALFLWRFKSNFLQHVFVLEEDELPLPVPVELTVYEIAPESAEV